MDSRLIFFFSFACLFSSVCGQEIWEQDYDDDFPPPYDGIVSSNDIFYPCQNRNKECLRSFIQKYTGCRGPSYEYQQEPIFRQNQMMYSSNLNVTGYYRNSYISNFNGRINNCYINKKTRRFVLVIHLNDVRLDIDNVYMAFHRFGREPIVTTDIMNMTFTITITAYTPITMHNMLDMDKTRFSGFIWNMKRLRLGKNLLNSQDPQVARTFNLVRRDITAAYKGHFLTETPSLFWLYMQKEICDFNKSISVGDVLRT